LGDVDGTYSHDGSTSEFQAVSRHGTTTVTSWVEPRALLGMTKGYDQVV
jgi:hypothetical protein